MCWIFGFTVKCQSKIKIVVIGRIRLFKQWDFDSFQLLLTARSGCSPRINFNNFKDCKRQLAELMDNEIKPRSMAGLKGKL